MEGPKGFRVRTAVEVGLEVGSAKGDEALGDEVEGKGGDEVASVDGWKVWTVVGSQVRKVVGAAERANDGEQMGTADGAALIVVDGAIFGSIDGYVLEYNGSIDGPIGRILGIAAEVGHTVWRRDGLIVKFELE